MVCAEGWQADLRKGVETVWLDPGTPALPRALQSGVRESGWTSTRAAWWTWHAPHHENEIAQCAGSFHQCPQWGNYFLHSGECRLLPVCSALLSRACSAEPHWVHSTAAGRSSPS